MAVASLETVVPRVDLSVVLCGRNDGHATDFAGDFTARLRRTVLSLLLGLCRRKVLSEIALVEWRPPNNTKGLRDVIFSWISELFARVGDLDCSLEALPLLRLITVSDAHAELGLKSVGQPLHSGMLEWSCKSVGLRRAVGDLLLTINGDDVPSPALFDFLAHARLLRRDTFYLAQTVGVYFGSQSGAPFFQVYDELFSRLQGDAEREASEEAAVRPELAFSMARRFCQRPVLFAANRSWSTYDRSCRLHVNNSAGNGSSMPRYFYDLYVGDFMLASRVAWHRIGGAPMLKQSVAIDWLVSCRFATRLRQVVLAAPCFNVHQNHPHSMTTNRKRVDARRSRELTDDMWERCRQPLRRLPSEHGVLRRQWGFPRLRLPEAHFTTDLHGHFRLVVYSG